MNIRIGDFAFARSVALQCRALLMPEGGDA